MHTTTDPATTSKQTTASIDNLSEEACWTALLARDPAFDGRFFFGVTTTGIFCRPSCPARRPRRANVRFYAAPNEAERDGLRACKRCRPTQADKPDIAAMKALCEYIRQHSDSGEPLTLTVLARRAKLTPARVRERFRDVIGITPRQFVEACRFGTFKEALRNGSPVTDAIYGAGFASASRVYEQTSARLGMTPNAFRHGGRGVEVTYTHAETPVGCLVVAGTDRGLCFVELGDDPKPLVERLHRGFPEATVSRAEADASPALRAWLEALCHHLEGRQPHLDLPLDIRATAFQQRVWQYLQTIPFGETRSYTDVARALGKPKAARAVASACAANPVALAIPCHRVLRASGHLGGYRWGMKRKQCLLDGERGNAGQDRSHAGVGESPVFKSSKALAIAVQGSD